MGTRLTSEIHAGLKRSTLAVAWLDCGDDAQSIYDGSCTGTDGGWGDGFLAAPVPAPASPPMTRQQWLAYLRQQLALAAAAILTQNQQQKPGTSPAAVPAELQMTSECWAKGVQGAGTLAYTLEVTYQIETSSGQAMSGASLANIAVSESFYAITGNTGVGTNPSTWTYGTGVDNIQPNGTFTDYLSAGGFPGLNNLSGSAFQTFTATGTLSNGVPLIAQPLTVLGFGAPTTVLSNTYSTVNGVTINGLGLGTNPGAMCK